MDFARLEDCPHLDSSTLEDPHQFCAIQMFLLTSFIVICTKESVSGKELNSYFKFHLELIRWIK